MMSERRPGGGWPAHHVAIVAVMLTAALLNDTALHVRETRTHKRIPLAWSDLSLALCLHVHIHVAGAAARFFESALRCGVLSEIACFHADILPRETAGDDDGVVCSTFCLAAAALHIKRAHLPIQPLPLGMHRQIASSNSNRN
jgi:hypothetical protein